MPLWRGHIVSGRAAAASMRVAWLGCVGLPPGSEAKGRRARPSGRNTRRDADIYSYQHPPWVHLHLAYHEGEGSRAGGTYATLDLPGGTTRPWRSAPETQNAPVRAPPPACRTTDSAPRPKSTHGANWHEDSAPTTPGAPPSTGTNASPPRGWLATACICVCMGCPARPVNWHDGSWREFRLPRLPVNWHQRLRPGVSVLSFPGSRLALPSPRAPPVPRQLAAVAPSSPSPRRRSTGTIARSSQARPGEVHRQPVSPSPTRLSTGT